MFENSNVSKSYHLSVKTRVTKVSLAIFFLISLFSNGQSVHADIAPPPAPEFGSFQPFQDTEVQMVYERVEMELQIFQPELEPETTQNRVIVNAYFVMQNQGPIDESMQVVFPLTTIPYCSGAAQNTNGESFTFYEIDEDSFKASVDGVSAPVTKIHTKRNLCTNYPWAAFDVTFPVDQEVLIKVTYVMESEFLDAFQDLEYILETGAGWKGTIGSGYIIIKFPYTITSDTILSSATPGYQILHNEVFWSFQDLEPTVENNIHISFISPDIWSSIQRSSENVKQEPASPDAWLELINNYYNISTTHGGDIIRDENYFKRIEPAYQQAVAANPNNAELHAQYARFKLYNSSPHLVEQLRKDEETQILSLLNKAIALESNNETAQLTLTDLLHISSFITFTPPPTIPPTATSLFTVTPSITPSATITPTPSVTPVVVTVIHTKIINSPTSTQIPELTATLVSTKTQKESGYLNIIFGALVVFAVGIGVGFFLSRDQKR